MFSCHFTKTFKNTFLTEHLRVTASVQAFVSFNLAFFTSVDVTYDFLMISGEIEVD